MAFLNLASIGNDITYPVVGGGLGFVGGLLISSRYVEPSGIDDVVPTPLLGALVGTAAGALAGFALAQWTNQKGPAGGTGLLTLSAAKITEGTGLFGGTTYTPGNINAIGSGFSSLTTIFIYDENSNVIATFTTGPLGNFNGNITVANYKPAPGTGYIVAYDTNTGKYSNKVSVTYT